MQLTLFILRYLNEGNDINTASDMKRALHSYGGVKGCRAAVCTVDTIKQDITTHKWKGITSFYNFEFNKDGIKVWKAFEIGSGKLITSKKLRDMAKPQGKTGLITNEPFSNPAEDKGAFTRTKTTAMKQVNEKQQDPLPSESETPDLEISEQRIFHCPNANCVKSFVSRKALEKHLDAGKHLYQPQKESVYDSIKRKWETACTSIRTVPQSNGDATDRKGGTLKKPPVAKGWALKISKRKSRFSTSLKSLLNGIFLEGEEMGNKADPSEVSSPTMARRSLDAKTG